MNAVTNGNVIIGRSNYDGSYWRIFKTDKPNRAIGAWDNLPEWAKEKFRKGEHERKT